MQAVILAGGMGSRLSEETILRPKPLVEIGGRPILWHLMKNLASQGISEFIILAGYKAAQIKEYFLNYRLYNSDISVDLAIGTVTTHSEKMENWKVTILDTGEHTLTGGRLLRAKAQITSFPFLFTYGDGLSDINLLQLRESHVQSGAPATVTAVRPQGRFGHLLLSERLGSTMVESFQEKGDNVESWINGGFFILENQVFEEIKEGDNTSFEYQTLPQLAIESKLNAYQHNGFWHAMDTIRDKVTLEDYWKENRAPWKTWN